MIVKKSYLQPVKAKILNVPYKKNYIYKIVVVGIGGSGKTTLFQKIKTAKFDLETKITPCVQFFDYEFPINMNNLTRSLFRDYDKKIKLIFFDFAGQERWSHIQANLCRGANIALFMVDLTRINSIEYLQEWVEIVERRYEELINGKVKGIPAEEVFKKIESRFK